VLPDLVLLGLSATVLWPDGRFYKTVALSQYALFLSAALGQLLSKTSFGRNKLFKKPYAFIRNGTAFLVACVNFLTGKRYEMWSHSAAPLSAPENQN
jgi:hypothetical protein